MVGYDSVYLHMRRRPPPICPIKGRVLPSLVSQSLALELSTSQNLAVTDTLDYACVVPSLTSYSLYISFIISFVLFVLYNHLPHHHSPCHKGLSMTSHRLLSSTEQKNHICCRMTSDATLVFSSCPNNTPTIGLRWFRGTKGLDLVGVFYVTAPLRIVESTLAPYSYPRFCNNWHPWVGDVNKHSQRIEHTFPLVMKDNSTCLSTLISESSLK